MHACGLWIIDAYAGICVSGGIPWQQLTCRRAAVVQRSHQRPTAPALSALQDLHTTQNMLSTCRVWHTRPAACAWHCMMLAFLDTRISTEERVWLLHACTCCTAYLCWRIVRANLQGF